MQWMRDQSFIANGARAVHAVHGTGTIGSCHDPEYCDFVADSDGEHYFVTRNNLSRLRDDIRE